MTNCAAKNNGFHSIDDSPATLLDHGEMMYRPTLFTIRPDLEQSASGTQQLPLPKERNERTKSVLLLSLHWIPAPSCQTLPAGPFLPPPLPPNSSGLSSTPPQ